MKYTDNYGLKKPELNDYVEIDDLNENADIIDDKLKEHEDELDSKETPAGAQAKADQAEQNAKQYTDEQISLVTESAVPSGVITMWSGSLTSIPTGWALCDGENGTPDLRDRFIVGAGSSYDPGDTGGSDSVTLTESQIPSHSHGSGTLSTSSAGSHSHSSGSYKTSTSGSHRHTYYYDEGVTIYEGDGSSRLVRRATGIGGDYNNTSSSGSHSHDITGSSGTAGSHSHSVSGTTSSTGGGNPHENRPPYYALAYIMKL